MGEEDLSDSSLVGKPCDVSESFCEELVPIRPSHVPFCKRLDLIPSFPVSLPHYVMCPPFEESSTFSVSHSHDSYPNTNMAKLYSSDNFSSFYVDSSLYFDSSSSSYFLIFPFDFSHFAHISSFRQRVLIYLVPTLLHTLAYLIFHESCAVAHEKLLRSLQSYLLNNTISPL